MKLCENPLFLKKGKFNSIHSETNLPQNLDVPLNTQRFLIDTQNLRRKPLRYHFLNFSKLSSAY